MPPAGQFGRNSLSTAGGTALYARGAEIRGLVEQNFVSGLYAPGYPVSKVGVSLPGRQLIATCSMAFPQAAEPTAMAGAQWMTLQAAFVQSMSRIRLRLSPSANCTFLTATTTLLDPCFAAQVRNTWPVGI